MIPVEAPWKIAEGPLPMRRHPASGYVQGINDLVTPFLAVFLAEHFDSGCSMSTWDLSALPEEALQQVNQGSAHRGVRA